jgi:bacterial/archaeal transporter family-2 protein
VNNSVFYALLMLLAGLGIPLMAALNGGLGNRLQNPPLAVTILFFVGLMNSLIYLLVNGGVAKTLTITPIPWYLYSGGIFVMFYISTITWVAPRFGISNAISFVLLGQLVAMCLIDRFGLVGAPLQALSTQRIIGIILMAVGVYLVVGRSASN